VDKAALLEARNSGAQAQKALQAAVARLQASEKSEVTLEKKSFRRE